MPLLQRLAACLPCGSSQLPPAADAAGSTQVPAPAAAAAASATASPVLPAADEAPKKNGLRTHVFFRWAAPLGSKPLKPQEEEVRVIGGCEELGNWDAKQGVILTAPFTAHVWKSKGVSLPLCRPVEYQYVVCEKGTGIQKRCLDERVGKRTVIPTGQRHILEDDGGAFRDQDHSGDFGAGSLVERGSSGPGSPKTTSPSNSGGAAGFQGKNSKAKQRLTESLERERELELTSADSVFVCVRTLPVRVEADGEGGWRVVQRIEKEKNPFTVANLLDKSRDEEEFKFSLKLVGQAGINVSDPAERRTICELLAPYQCIPVFAGEGVDVQHETFSRQFLWPVMHNMKVLLSEDFNEAQYRGYQALNKAYADAVEENAPQKAMIWIHDFHLLFVPRYLKLKAKQLTLGFFLHCAFPSSEVLRSTPMRDDIMVSLLSCHVVSFQIFEYTRHFLTCCQMIVDSTVSFQEGGVLQIEYDNRSVVVRTDHIVLPVNRLATMLEDEAVNVRYQNIRKTYGDRKIFAAIDGDEPFSGMPMKIRAFQNFLSDCPQHRHAVALFQYVALKNQDETVGREILEVVQGLAQEVNQTFCLPGEPPLVHICTEKLSIQERLGLLRAADVLLDTSINDGLNLYPFMFYVAHTKDQKGIAIISEFTGCSSALTGSLKVNPWNTKAVVEAMHNAVIMDENEQAVRFLKDHSYVSSQAFGTWVNQNLLDLKATQNQQNRTISFATSGFNMSFMASGFRPLNVEQVVKTYKSAQTRCIFLDSEGTLISGNENRIRSGKAKYGEGQVNIAGMEGDVLDTVKKLVADQRNMVIIISGREKQAMDQWYGTIPDVGLCAEHGFYYVMPKKLKSAASGNSNEKWQEVKGIEAVGDWKSVVFELFKQYVKRVQGSFVQYKGSAISWHYKEVGAPAIAREIAGDLMRFLDPKEPNNVLYNCPVSVISGKGYVEVKHESIDKGKAVRRILDAATQVGLRPDFILCIGDDRADEDMFNEISNWQKRGESCDEGPSPSPLSPKKIGGTGSSTRRRERKGQTVEDLFANIGEDTENCYTVTVGRKPSSATFFVKDINDVGSLLQKLAQEGVKSNFSRVSSVPDGMMNLQKLGTLGGLAALSAVEEDD